MDESFQLRARLLLGGSRPAPLDHAMLTAALAAQRAAGNGTRPPVQDSAAFCDPLTEILLAGPRWRQAASAQSGCFNRTEVKRRLNLR